MFIKKIIYWWYQGRILKIVTGLSVFIVEDIPGVWAVVECISPIPNQCPFNSDIGLKFLIPDLVSALYIGIKIIDHL